MYKPLMVNNKPDETKKRCYDCKHCQGTISWWCVNEKAVEARGTAIPGIKNCTFWEPATHIDDLPKKKISIMGRIMGRKKEYVDTTGYIEIDK